MFNRNSPELLPVLDGLVDLPVEEYERYEREEEHDHPVGRQHIVPDVQGVLAQRGGDDLQGIRVLEDGGNYQNGEFVSIFLPLDIDILTCSFFSCSWISGLRDSNGTDSISSFSSPGAN